MISRIKKNIFFLNAVCQCSCAAFDKLALNNFPIDLPSAVEFHHFQEMPLL